MNRSDILSRMYDETLDVLESAEVVDVCLSNVANAVVYSKVYSTSKIRNARAFSGSAHPSASSAM